MLSVIIPVFNGEKYIGNLLNCFENQNTTCRHELVFVDDGSKDNSLKILSSVKSNKFSVSVYSQENKGVSSARNLGIKYAKGDFIAFADIDDYVTTDYFECLENSMKSSESDIFVFDSIRIRSEDELTAKSDKELIVKEIGKEEVLLQMLSNPTRYGVYNLMLKKEFVEANKIRFSEGYKYYEDYDFIFRSLALSSNTMITEKPLYYYMLREQSAMQRFTVDRITCLNLMENLEPFFDDNVPEFSETFKKWGVSRIYWSVLWQAALAFNYKDFLTFAKKTSADEKLKNLSDFPSKKVSLSSALYTHSKLMYYIAANASTRGKTKIEKSDINGFRVI